MGETTDGTSAGSSAGTEATPADADHEAGIQVAIVSGLSGAGRSTAAKCLEDLGWFVVDNLPPALVASVLDLARRAEGVDRVACVVDIRSRAFSSDLRGTVAELEKQGLQPRVLFLEASDEAL